MIDNEFGDMVMQPGDDANWTGQKLFAYLRYDPDVSQAGLDALNLNYVKAENVQVMDSVEFISDIQRVGSSYAARRVNIAHYNGFY